MFFVFIIIICKEFLTFIVDKMMWVSILRNTIKIHRKELGLRQEDVAEKVGVTRQTIIAIENSKYNPTLELAMKLSKLLDKPVEEIFHLEE